MKTALKQANFQIPEDSLSELRATVGKCGLSRFVSEALKQELQRRRQLTAIDETFGAWKGGKHPKLAVRVGRFVGNIKKPLVENAAMHRNSVDMIENMKIIATGEGRAFAFNWESEICFMNR